MRRQGTCKRPERGSGVAREKRAWEDSGVWKADSQGLTADGCLVTRLSSHDLADFLDEQGSQRRSSSD